MVVSIIGLGGNLYHTNLSEEAAMALAQASEHQPIAAAIDSEDNA